MQRYMASIRRLADRLRNFPCFYAIGEEIVTLVTTLAKKPGDKDVKFATALGADLKGPQMTTLAQENTVAKQLRPLVMLVAAFSLSVAVLLVTTASLGASPINSMEVASLQ
jgi:hypothetical protein